MAVGIDLDVVASSAVNKRPASSRNFLPCTPGFANVNEYDISRERYVGIRFVLINEYNSPLGNSHHTSSPFVGTQGTSETPQVDDLGSLHLRSPIVSFDFSLNHVRCRVQPL